MVRIIPMASDPEDSPVHSSANGFPRRLFILPEVKHTLGLLLIAGSSAILSTSATGQVGDLPVPVLQGVQVSEGVSFDLGSLLYTYTYTITNPATNTGEIWHLGLDVSTQFPPAFGSSGLTIPIGPGRFKPFDQKLADIQPLDLSVGSAVIPFGQTAPAGWTGGLRRDGFASFFSDARANRIRPGTSLGGFGVVSQGVPTIRNMEVKPFWILVSTGDATPDEEQAAIDTQKAIISNNLTLGPSAAQPGSFSQWNQLRDDLNRAIQEGWVADPALATTLVSQLTSARQAEDASDGTTAKVRLQSLLDAVGQATASQIRQEARDLVSLNVQALIANTPDTPIPFEPKVSLSPQSSSFPLGGLSAVTASVLNIGDPTTPPIPGFPISFRILDGPDAGQFQLSGVTGADGKLTFSYIGQQLGTDRVNAFRAGEVPVDFGTVSVNWTGGPDLVIQFFIPPVINAGPGQPIPLTEITGNIGSTPAGPSVTRYFLSANPIPDPTFDQPLGERPVPPLNPGESSQSSGITLSLPSGLAVGTYRLGACADADQTVAELNELNNCRPTQVVIALKQSNQPPDCSKAQPSVSSLWPPNHRLVPITFTGISDPNGDTVTLKVTKITQDEPVNGLGPHDTSPDGFGVGTSQAQVRAERLGTGNGRVYAITLTADDGKGGTCNATVNVGVPHDQGAGSVPIDDGQSFDSTLP